MLGHDAGGLGKPLILAHRHTDIATPGLTDLEAGIAWVKMKFLMITRSVGNIALAVVAHNLAVSLYHHDSIVIAVVSLFKETNGQHHA